MKTKKKPTKRYIDIVSLKQHCRLHLWISQYWICHFELFIHLLEGDFRSSLAIMAIEIFVNTYNAIAATNIWECDCNQSTVNKLTVYSVYPSKVDVFVCNSIKLCSLFSVLSIIICFFTENDCIDNSSQWHQQIYYSKLYFTYQWQNNNVWSTCKLIFCRSMWSNQMYQTYFKKKIKTFEKKRSKMK